MVKYKRSCSKAQLAALARGRAIRARNIQLGGASRRSRSPRRKGWRSPRHSSGSSSGSPSPRSPSRSPRRAPPDFGLGPSILERRFGMGGIEDALPSVSPCAARRPRKSKSQCSNCTALLAILAAAGIGAAGKFGTVGKVRKLITGKRSGDMCVDGAPPHNLLHKDHDLAQELCGEYAYPVQSCRNKDTPGDVVWFPNRGKQCARLSHGEKKVKAYGNRKSMNRQNKTTSKRKKSGKNKRKTGRKR